MKIILAPNPYRDKQFQTALQAKKILEESGCQTCMCLPFDVDRDFELPRGIRFTDIRTEIRDADMLICFGGDGTILHTSKIATQHNLPVLGVNIGTMGFIAELESSELELLRKIPEKNYTIENRSMLDITVSNGTQQTFHEIALNDAVVTKGAIARVIQIAICCDGVVDVGRRADHRAVGQESAADADLRARDAGQEHRARPAARRDHPGEQDRATQCLSLRGWRAGVPHESERRDHGEKL